MNSKSIEQAKDTDMASSIIAIRRAAKRAGQLAAQTGTSLIVWKNGKIERVAVQLPEAQTNRPIAKQ